MIAQGAKGVVLAALAATALSGCAFKPQLQRVAVDHNRMVAEAEDELTLLNIVRASHRFPLHFTTVTQVNGQAKLSFGSDLAVALNPGPNPTGTGLGAEVSTAPSFQASVLSSEEFQRGIQSPISAELVAYYLDEGWPDELIMALFIERLEPANSSRGRSEAVINDPSQSGAFARILCTHELVTRPTTASRPLAQFEELIDLGVVDGEASSPSDRRKEIEAFLALTRKDGVELAGDTLVLTGSSNSVRLVPRKTPRCEGNVPDTSGATYQPRFRSTLGVIYFLGEYLREAEESQSGAVYKIPSCDGSCDGEPRNSRPLIAIRSGAGEALVSTEFRGERFYISASEENGAIVDEGERPRTMQVIAIIQQLLNLQKSADTLPQSLSITGLN